MGTCSSTVKRVRPAPASETTPPAPTTSRADAVAPLALTTEAAASAADARSEAPTAFERVMDGAEDVEYVADDASDAVDKATAVLDAAPPGVVDNIAAGASSAAAEAVQYAVDNAPGMADFIGKLCGTAADLLGSIAPAIPFGGIAAAVLGMAAKQGQAYADAMQAARDLQQVIADRRPTIEQFAASAPLARANASLVGHAAQALRDAVALLRDSYSKDRRGGRRLRSEVWKFFTAQGGLKKLQDAATGISVRACGGGVWQPRPALHTLPPAPLPHHTLPTAPLPASAGPRRRHWGSGCRVRRCGHPACRGEGGPGAGSGCAHADAGGSQESSGRAQGRHGAYRCGDSAQGPRP